MNNIEELLKSCGCKDVKELWNYIGYLEDVKRDYEFLKGKLKNLVSGTMEQLY